MSVSIRSRTVHRFGSWWILAAPASLVALALLLPTAAQAGIFKGHADTTVPDPGSEQTVRDITAFIGNIALRLAQGETGPFSVGSGNSDALGRLWRVLDSGRASHSAGALFLRRLVRLLPESTPLADAPSAWQTRRPVDRLSQGGAGRPVWAEHLELTKFDPTESSPMRSEVGSFGDLEREAVDHVSQGRGRIARLFAHDAPSPSNLVILGGKEHQCSTEVTILYSRADDDLHNEADNQTLAHVAGALRDIGDVWWEIGTYAGDVLEGERRAHLQREHGPKGSRPPGRFGRMQPGFEGMAYAEHVMAYDRDPHNLRQVGCVVSAVARSQHRGGPHPYNRFLVFQSAGVPVREVAVRRSAGGRTPALDYLRAIAGPRRELGFAHP